jgi:uncharacterized membrane protein
MLRKTRKFVGGVGCAVALGWMGYIQFTHIDDSELRLLIDHWPAYLAILAIIGVSYSMLLPTRKERMERSQAIRDALRER